MRRAELRLLAGALVGGVLVLDLLWSLIEGSTGAIGYGLIDEPAHLATCVVALLAVLGLTRLKLSPRFVAAALIASVAIDVDHIPHYLGSHLLMASAMPRPYSHALLTVVLLAGLGLCLRGGGREISFGLAFGVAAHLCRDLATGPGIPLFWPLSAGAVTVPYAVYAVALVGAGVGVFLAARARRRSRRPARARPALVARPLPSAGRPGGS